MVSEAMKINAHSLRKHIFFANFFLHERLTTIQRMNINYITKYFYIDILYYSSADPPFRIKICLTLFPVKVSAAFFNFYEKTVGNNRNTRKYIHEFYPFVTYFYRI